MGFMHLLVKYGMDVLALIFHKYYFQLAIYYQRGLNTNILHIQMEGGGVGIPM